jgi:hypothetical protein
MLRYEFVCVLPWRVALVVNYVNVFPYKRDYYEVISLQHQEIF